MAPSWHEHLNQACRRGKGASNPQALEPLLYNKASFHDEISSLTLGNSAFPILLPYSVLGCASSESRGQRSGLYLQFGVQTKSPHCRNSPHLEMAAKPRWWNSRFAILGADVQYVGLVLREGQGHHLGGQSFDHGSCGPLQTVGQPCDAMSTGMRCRLKVLFGLCSRASSRQSPVRMWNIVECHVNASPQASAPHARNVNLRAPSCSRKAAWQIGKMLSSC